MNDGRREKKKIKVQGAGTPSAADAAHDDSGASDLNVADAVDVAFEDIMTEVGPRRGRAKPDGSSVAKAAARP